MNAPLAHEVERAVDELLAGQTIASVTRPRAAHVLGDLARRVHDTAEADALQGLLSVEDVARHFGVTAVRIRAKVRWLRQRGQTVGWKVPGTRAWLFRRTELDSLAPLPRGGYRRRPAE